jgi:hypothetical protein
MRPPLRRCRSVRATVEVFKAAVEVFKAAVELFKAAVELLRLPSRCQGCRRGV